MNIYSYISNPSSFSSWPSVAGKVAGSMGIVHNRRVYSRAGLGRVRYLRQSVLGSPETTSSWWWGSQLIEIENVDLI